MREQCISQLVDSWYELMVSSIYIHVSLVVELVITHYLTYIRNLNVMSM